MTKLSRAICFATEKFDGIVRKASSYPAIFHSLETAAIARSVCDDEDVACAAVLHDTVEDAGVKLEEIGEKFGERVMKLVGSETEKQFPGADPKDTWVMRKTESLKRLRESVDIGTKVMWLGDKLSNMRSFALMHDKLGDEMWREFNQKDPIKQKNYYTAIVHELECFADTDEYRELAALTRRVFGE